MTETKTKTTFIPKTKTRTKIANTTKTMREPVASNILKNLN